VHAGFERAPKPPAFFRFEFVERHRQVMLRIPVVEFLPQRRLDDGANDEIGFRHQIVLFNEGRAAMLRPSRGSLLPLPVGERVGVRGCRVWSQNSEPPTHSLSLATSRHWGEVTRASRSHALRAPSPRVREKVGMRERCQITQTCTNGPSPARCARDLSPRSGERRNLIPADCRACAAAVRRSCRAASPERGRCAGGWHAA